MDIDDINNDINNDIDDNIEDNISLTPNIISYGSKNQKIGTRRKWNEIEDIWLKWIYNSVRQKKYEIYLDGINNYQYNGLPTRFPWSFTHKRFNKYYDYIECFKTFDDLDIDNDNNNNNNNNNIFINKNIGKYLSFRSEDSIKQHWRNPLWTPHDNKSKELYCLENNINYNLITNEEWNNINERIKFLYRRAVIHQYLLFKFINTAFYNGKSLGIRIMGKTNKHKSPNTNIKTKTKTKTWLVTYSDLKILRFNSHLKAAQGWDYEVRTNHGLIIDSNLPISVQQYINLTNKIYKIWNNKNINIKQKWLKLKIILIDEYMDEEYGIYPTLQSLFNKLIMIYQWKNQQKMKYYKLQKKKEKKKKRNT
eukprot:66138_1